MPMTDTYLDELNEQQREAVEYIDGPQLVIAGAGSGKTRVLTYKIMHLIAKGYEPYRILALTFTNKAAREMRERIELKVESATARRIWMGTFHSIFSRILRQNSDKIGYNKDYTIYDAGDSKSLIKTIIKDMDLDDKIYKPSTVQNSISWAKNALYSPDDYARDRELIQSDERAKRGRTVDIYRAYVARCRTANAMDFDDLLYYTAILFRENPEILRHYKEFFRYILVDEYQDTNFAQNMIIMQLSQGVGNICVVGDDAQSIYSFRGANIRNILELKRSFPTLRTDKLERNYRSTQNIINAANSLIAKNENQIRKEIYSLNDVGEKIEVQSGHSDYDEAGLVASRIVTRRATTGDPYAEFAILYRTNAQSRVLEEALRRRNIAYRIYGGHTFYQRKEVKDALSYFKLAVNPNDEEAIKRVINVPARGIGKTTLDKITACASERSISLWDVLTDPVGAGLQVNTGTFNKLTGFVNIVNRFIELNNTGTDAELLAREIISSTGLLRMYMTDHAPETISKRENLEELLRGTHEFVTDKREAGEVDSVMMSDFLGEVSLATDQDEENEHQDDCVTLMTIHASKGLEFSNVFVVGVEEDLLPSSMCNNQPDEIEEERRLFYVAITRAKNFCMLTYAASRYLNGQPKTCRPSRFLKDIDTSYLRFSYGAERMPFENTVSRFRPTARIDSGSSTTAERRPLFEPTPARPVTPPAPAAMADGTRIHTRSELDTGMKIVHVKFGEGIITGFSENSQGDMAIVNFTNSGERRLLLQYAKFMIVK
mgnify:CR=1 FL=1